MARKYLIFAHKDGYLASFNGAAPRMARKCKEAVKAAQEVKLQWGRATNGAEISYMLRPTKKPSRLQWGRATNGAEIAAVVVLVIPSVVLQWGRATNGAEIRRPSGWWQKVRCFNGAAPRMARK